MQAFLESWPVDSDGHWHDARERDGRSLHDAGMDALFLRDLSYQQPRQSYHSGGDDYNHPSEFRNSWTEFHLSWPSYHGDGDPQLPSTASQTGDDLGFHRPSSFDGCTGFTDYRVIVL